jgi:hypothetical protein
MLRLDKVFQKIAGFDDYPVQSTISRFLGGWRENEVLTIGYFFEKLEARRVHV